MFSRKKKTAVSTARSAGQKLLSLDFVLLFFLVLFSNCYLAVYYSTASSSGSKALPLRQTGEGFSLAPSSAWSWSQGPLPASTC